LAERCLPIEEHKKPFNVDCVSDGSAAREVSLLISVQLRGFLEASS